LFRLFRIHVLLPEKQAGGFDAARRQIFDALQAGRFYSAIEAAAEAGTYRAEVFLRERTPLRSGIPWIASNPILIRKETP
jgi:hypothetical protein